MALSYVCSHCRRFQLEDCSWWVSLGRGDSAKSRKKQCNWLCAACGQYNWKDPNRVSVKQDGAEPTTVKVFRAHAEPQGACENLPCAFSLLANQGKYGGSLVDTIFEGVGATQTQNHP